MITRYHSNSRCHFHYIRSTLIVLLFIQLSVSQDTSTTGGEIDESLVNRWDDTIQFEGCFKDLVKADRNGDKIIKEDEYLSFIQEYGKRICFTTDQLNIQQKGVFNSLACLCHTNTIASLSTQEQGIANGQCCFGNNAQIALSTASNDKNQRSPAEQDYLTTVCKLTDATIDGKCRPIIAERDTPLVPFLPAQTPSSSGLDWWEWLLIALAALLLFCLACCCVWKKRKGTNDDDEENQGTTTKQMDGIEKHPSLSTPKRLNNTEPMYPEKPIDQSILKPVKVPNEPKESFVVNSNPNVFPVQLRSVGPPIIGALAKEVAEKALAAASVAGSRSTTSDDDVNNRDGPMNVRANGNTVGDSDSDDDDEIRKKFGGQRLPNEPDEEVLRIIGSPQLEPINPIPPKPIILQPIPNTEKEDNEWDQPGRNIEYPTCTDDDSGQVLDPYIPDGGVIVHERSKKESLDWRKEWHRQYPDEPEIYDNRKHRIQSGLGEGELWNKLDNDDDTTTVINKSNTNGAFDWVVQSALGALNENTTTGSTNTSNNTTTKTKI